MPVDAQQILKWSEELAHLAALPAADVLGEVLDVSLAIEEAMPGSAPETPPENLAKMADLCLRYLAVRPVPVPDDSGPAIRCIVSAKNGRMWSLALLAEYTRELAEVLAKQREASAEAEALKAEASALRRRRDRMERYAGLLDALAGKPPAAGVESREDNTERGMQ
jgi:hypothetical protein